MKETSADIERTRELRTHLRAFARGYAAGVALTALALIVRYALHSDDPPVPATQQTLAALRRASAIIAISFVIAAGAFGLYILALLPAAIFGVRTDKRR